MPESSKLTIYNSLFRCHLEYCNIAWGNCNSSLLMQLQKLQKKSLRHIANKKANSHVNPLYKKYNLLNVKDSINYNFGVFMYQYTYDSLPCSFTNLFTKLHTHDRNLNYKTNFVKPHCLKSNPMNRMPNLWNSLNLDLKRSRSLSIFKNNLTKYFHDQYDVKCNVQNCFACNWVALLLNPRFTRKYKILQHCPPMNSLSRLRPVLLLLNVICVHPNSFF